MTRVIKGEADQSSDYGEVVKCNCALGEQVTKFLVTYLGNRLGDDQQNDRWNKIIWVCVYLTSLINHNKKWR